MKNLVQRIKTISSPNNVEDDLNKLKNIIKSNGYKGKMLSSFFVDRNSKKQCKPAQQTRRFPLTFFGKPSEKIKRILKKSGIETYWKRKQTVQNFLRPKVEPTGEPGVIYKIDCKKCGKYYIGETGALERRKYQHNYALQTGKVPNNAIYQHWENTGHKADVSNAKVILEVQHQTERRIKEALIIEKWKNNFNQSKGQQLTTSWGAWRDTCMSELLKDLKKNDPIGC